MPTQTGSIDFKSTKGFQSYASGQYATLTQVKGQFATCSTAAGTQAKAATIVPSDTGWELYTGATITVRFTADNTHATPTLNVNSTGAKSIRDHTGAALTEEAYKWKAGDALAFTYDGTYWRMQDTLAQRVTTNKTAIEQNASDITFRATKEEAAQMAQPNLSPYFSSSPYDKTANSYWYGMGVNSSYTFTDMGDGWMRVQCTNSGSSVIRVDWYPIKCPSVVAGQPYTWLAEIRNNASTSASSGSDFYLVQNNNCQFWGQKAIETIEGPSGAGMSINIGTCGSSYVLQKVQNAETASDGHWTNNDEASVVGLACWTFRCAANSSIDYEVRLSLYSGRYAGPYKPYVGPQLYASQAELKVTADGITSTVSSIASAKYVNSKTASWPLASLKTYAAEGHSENWNVTSTDGLRVGDTVYVKGTDGTRNCTVYIKTTVTAVNSTTNFTGTSHGYEDVLPVDTVKSTINQSSDSVKIEARHVDIVGATIFTTGRLSESSLNNAYDAKGAAEDAVNNLEIGGRNLVLKTGEAKTSAVSASDSSYTSNYTLSDYGHSIMNNADDEWYCSFDYEVSGNSESNVNVYFQFRGSATTVDITPKISGNASGHYGESFKLTSAQASSTSNNCRFRMQRATDGATLTITNFKLEKGNKATDWSPAPEDLQSNAVKRTQRIWYRKSAEGAPATPGTASSNWVVKDSDGSNAWTKMHVAISSTEKFIYTCEQYEMGDGTVGYTSVLLDNTITVIDGGNIITGSVTANKLNASNINASKVLTVGAMTDAAASTILNSNVQVGGRNLLVDSSTGNGWNKSTFNATSCEYTRSTTATTESYVQAKIMTFEPGETYTVSCFAKSNGYVRSLDIYKVHSSGGGSHQQLQNIVLTTEYQRVVWTFVCNATTTETAYIRFDNNGSTTSETEAILYIKEPKLEKGNKATDWTPAPEDVTNDINAVSTAMSEANEGLADSIAEVSKSLEEANTRITNLTNAVADADADRAKWVQVDSENGITIGAVDSSYNLVLDNNSVDFMVGDQLAATASIDAFIPTALRLGDYVLSGSGGYLYIDYQPLT